MDIRDTISKNFNLKFVYDFIKNLNVITVCTFYSYINMVVPLFLKFYEKVSSSYFIKCA